MIAENLREIETEIQAVCSRCGRNRSDVTLIAVSKTKPLEMVEEAAACGIRDFGENYPQELKEKAETIKDQVRWHQIGHLQRNKVKYIIDKVCLIHSVDSLRLAQQINAEAEKRGLICDILIEVNIAEEESKFGVTRETVYPLLEEISGLANIRVKGLMTIAPYVENPEENRIHFRNLHNLSVDIKSKNIDNVTMNELSMGMTGDYQVAIEEGATMIRVGTGIFGARDYSR